MKISCSFGGPDRDRTDYLRNAIATLSQMSYGPFLKYRSKKANRYFRFRQFFLTIGKTDQIILAGYFQHHFFLSRWGAL